MNATFKTIDPTALCVDETPEGTYQVSGFTTEKDINYMSLKADNDPLIALLNRNSTDSPHIVLYEAAKFAIDEGFKVKVRISKRSEKIHVDFMLSQGALDAWSQTRRQ